MNFEKVLFALAYFTLKSGQNQKAMVYARVCSSLFPNNAKSYGLAALAHFLVGEYELAVENAEIWQERASEDSDKKAAMLLTAWSYARLGRHEMMQKALIF